ncbi:flagellar export protein FliJ [Clostridium sp. WILCCON 0269]|uniref:Flagellar FliJ protein n=1 Tax=Candidatus Clostridium eludens TaxID=3381663 RepID=A0ABW8SJX5_9CLOT
MKGYRFRLQKLLDMRVDKEEESKIQFQQAQNESLKTKEKLIQMEETYKKYNNISSGSIIEQKIRHIYIKNLTYNINETIEELQEKEKIVESKREELKQRQMDRKTVEILKDKDIDTFKKEQNRIEQNLNDEFALYGFIRSLRR